MALENFINSLKNRPTVRGVERTKQERFEQAVMEKHKTEADFLQEIKKAEQVKREEIEHFAEQVPQFLSQVDECVNNYHAKYQNEKNKQEVFSKYDELLIKIREATEVFLSNLEDKEFVELLEHDIDTISDLCKKIYELDRTFPNFAFLDENKFKDAAIKEIYGNSEMAKGVKFEKVGRFTVVGKESGFYYIVDQQARKAFKEEVHTIGKVRNNSIVISTASGFFGDLKKKLFFGETGKTSAEYSSIQPGLGKLWLAQRGEAFDILNNKGEEIFMTWQYDPNKNQTRALVKLEDRVNYSGRHFNVLLEDGNLLFDKDKPISLRRPFNSITKNKKIVDEAIVEHDNKFFKLNKDLEIIAQGSSLEEIQNSQEEVA